MGTAPRSFSPVHPGARSKMEKRRGRLLPGRNPAKTLDRGKPGTSSSSSSFALSSRRRAAAGKLAARQSRVSDSSDKPTAKAAAHRGGQSQETAAGDGGQGGTLSLSSAECGDGYEQDAAAQRGSFPVSFLPRGSRGRRSDGTAAPLPADYRSSRLFVRGLPPFVSAAELKEKFSSLGGEVTDVCLLLNEAGRSRQCAFVGLKTQSQASAAKDYFDGSFFYTRKIAVEFALPKSADAAAPSSRRKTEKHTAVAGGLEGAVAAAAEAAAGATAAGNTRAERLKKRGKALTAAAAAGREAATSSSSSRGANSGRQEHAEQPKRNGGAGFAKGGKVAGGVVVEEATVQARKAGVNSVRKRLIFDDFFSSSDEEEPAREVEGEKTGHEGDSTSRVRQHSSRAKRAKVGADTPAEAADGGSDSHRAAASSGQRTGASNSNLAGAGVCKPGAAAAEGDSSSKGDRGGGGETGGGSAFGEVVDDLAWLRQTSAAHAAERALAAAAEAGTRAAGGAAAEGREAAARRGEAGGEGAAGGRGTRRKGGGAATAGGGTEEAAAAATGTGAGLGAAEDEAKKEEREKALGLLGVHGRLLLRNFPFATTQEELQALCEQHGEVAEVHVVHDEETRKSKGYAFVSYVFPEHAVTALTKLDGMIFQGRLLEAEAAKPDEKKELRQQLREETEQNKKGNSSSYKRKKQQELLQQHTENQAFMEEKVWNLLYVSANAAVDAVAREFHVDKTELLGHEEAGKKAELSAAARVALAETHLLQATREWIVKEGISPKAFERRGPTLLAAAAAPTSSASPSGRNSSSSSSTRSAKGRSNDGEGAETHAAAQRQTREDKEEKEEETAGRVGRSRDTLIVKHLPTAHVVGAELLRMFEGVGPVVRFLLAPSKTVAIVQYEKERDAAAAFRRLAYRKYKTVPLFIEKAPVDIFVGEEEQRRQAQIEAAAETSAASHADALTAASAGQGGAGKGGGTDGGVRSGVAAVSSCREGQGGGGGEERGAGRGGVERNEIVNGRATKCSANGAAGEFSRKKKKTAVGQGKATGAKVETSEDAEEADECGACTAESASRRVAAGAYGDAFCNTGGVGRTAITQGGRADDEGQREEPTEDVSGNSLFVKNLNFCTTEAALYEVFAGCAGLRSVKLMTKKRPATKRTAEEEKRENVGESSSCNSSVETTTSETLSLGYAFVEFDSATNAAAACKQMQDVVADAHTLKIAISRSAPQRRKGSSSRLPIGGAASAGGGCGGAAAAAGRGAVKSRKLLVRNLAFQATAADLRGLFSAYGNVTRVCIPTQHEGRSRGFAFVEFATRPEAAAALQALSGTHLYGRKLVLEVALQETQGAGKS